MKSSILRLFSALYRWIKKERRHDIRALQGKVCIREDYNYKQLRNEDK